MDVGKLAEVIVLQIVAKEVDWILVVALFFLFALLAAILLAALWVVLRWFTLFKGFNEFRVPDCHVDISVEIAS